MGRKKKDRHVFARISLRLHQSHFLLGVLANKWTSIPETQYVFISFCNDVVYIASYGRISSHSGARIAALALQHDLTLITRDAHFEEVDLLDIEAW